MSGILAAVTQRDFRSEAQIRDLVSEAQIKDLFRQNNEQALQALYGSASHAKAERNSDDLRAMLIFVTEKQQTWLVADSLMAYCVLDDRRREEPRIQWRKKLAAALPVQVSEIRDEHWSAKAGILHFGDEPQGWMYSKALFAHTDVEAAATGFLSNVHASPAAR